MTQECLKILPYQKKGDLGPDIAVLSARATVADYCHALEEYILTEKYHRKRARVEQCEGCDLCCHERIPLTSIDVMRLSEQLGTDFLGFLRKYAYVSVSGRVVDITLGRREDESCLFLDKNSGRCRTYQSRPFVCRTYLCAVSAPRLQRLRESITNSGEDELVRLWLAAAQDSQFIMNEAIDADVRAADWPANGWTGKRDFDEIALREIVTPDIWAELSEKGDQDV